MSRSGEVALSRYERNGERWINGNTADSKGYQVELPRNFGGGYEIVISLFEEID